MRSVASTAWSATTAPVRATVGAAQAVQRGRSVGRAVTRTRVGNTTVLKVGQTAGAAAAVYVTAGAAGAALGSAGLVSASTAAGMGMASATGMGIAAAGQLATQGYIAPNAMAKAGLVSAGAAAGNGVNLKWKALQDAQKIKQAHDAYQGAQKAYQNYKDAKRQGADIAAANAELAALTAELERAQRANDSVAVEAASKAIINNPQVAAAQPKPQHAIAAGLVALKLLAFV